MSLLLKDPTALQMLIRAGFSISAKIIRTDCELECPAVDQALRDTGAELVLLPDGVDEEALRREVSDADLLLICYSPIITRVIERARRLKGIGKYGASLDVFSAEPLSKIGHMMPPD